VTGAQPDPPRAAGAAAEGGAGAAGAGAGGGAAPEVGGPAPGSGLRNPAAAVRGVGAASLLLEAVVLLLAIVPLVKLGGHHTGAALGVVGALAAGCVLLAGLMRHRWAWYAALAVQGLLVLGGVLSLVLLALGVLFGGVWGYVLSVRRTVLGRI
jgi:Protein of unknown function (DUF4233)